MYKRLTIIRSLLAGNTASLAHPKYMVPGNEEVGVTFYPSFAMIGNMLTRLPARGWKVVRNSGNVTVLVKEWN